MQVSAPSVSAAPAQRRQILVLFALTAIAVAGNLAAVTVFYRVDFMFGSVAILLVARLYGPLVGAACAAIASAYTLVRWEQDYTIVIFMAEAVFVGALLRRGRANLVLIDALYWLVLGMPLVWVFYRLVLDIAPTGAVVIALKQSVNGLVNAVIASIVGNLPRVRRWLGRRAVGAAVSLHERMFNLLITLVLLPSLVLMILTGRERMDHIERDAAGTLSQLGAAVVGQIADWRSRHVQVVRSLAAAAGTELGNLPQIQDQLRTLVQAFPDFHNMYVANGAGTTVAFHPPVNTRGESTLGLDFSDRPYYRLLRDSRAPVISNVFVGRGGVFTPIITISAPIPSPGPFVGFALGALDLRNLSNILRPYTSRGDARVTIVDGEDRIVATSTRSWHPMDRVADRREGVMRTVDADTWVWAPPMTGEPAMVRWQASVFVQEHRVNGMGAWRVIVETPLAPVVADLYESLIRFLASVWMMSLVALLIARLTSRWFARPIRLLGEVTTDLPDRLLEGRPVTWPTTTTAELESLVTNFKTMSAALEQHVRALQDQSRMLAHANEELRDEMAERKRLEQHVRQSQKMQAVGTLAAGIAHDFNNLLAMILGWSALVRKDVEDGSAAARRIEEVQSAGLRARDVVQQILTFSRQQEQTRMPVSLGPVLRETVRLLRTTLPSSIEIRERVDPRDPAVLGDPTQFQQVVMNLATNAEHAMRQGGGVLDLALDVVELEHPLPAVPAPIPAGEWVRLRVADTGRGMAPEVVERIFEPFFTTKPVGEGTGMGLSVVHGIIAAIGGFIDVNSTPGEGTRIDVYLPRVAPQAAPPEPAPPRESRGTERVLFVDDEPALAMLGREMLEYLGYDVVSCGSSAAALHLIAEDPARFHILVTDQTMPEMTGDVLIREARALRPDLPVILCTGYSQTMSPETADDQGIDAFLYKPIVAEELGAAIRDVLARRG